MKIAIQGHLTRGNEVIQILESLGGKNGYDQLGSNERFVYFINNIGCIYSVTPQMCSNERKIYTLEEFEKEFPYKIGDKVITIDGTIGIIDRFEPEKDYPYCIKADVGGFYWCATSILKPYKEMKEERNITLSLDKAKEWYKKGGELKEIALQAFSEKELNSLPRNWAEFCINNPIKCGEVYISSCSKFIGRSVGARDSVYDRYVCPSRESAEAHLAMIQLEQLRDCWRQGWKPNWLNGNVQKYVIQKWRDKISIQTTYVTHSFLSFPTYEMAKEFLECFRDLIEKAGDLI